MADGMILRTDPFLTLPIGPETGIPKVQTVQSRCAPGFCGFRLRQD
jgi:hypothetical protein